MNQKAYDVIVLGLGGMGSAAAYHLASRGKRVLGLEQFSPAHNLGSSHGDSRIIRQAYFEDPGYVPLALRAYELWQKLERDANIDILRRTGGLMIGHPQSSVVAGAMLSAKSFHLPFEVLEAAEMRRRFPAFLLRPEDIAVYEPAAGYLRPEAAIHAHLQLATQRGADLHFHEAATGWAADRSNHQVTVTTNLASYEAEQLIVAPGAWAPDLLTDLQIPFDIRRHVMCWFQPETDPGQFQPDRFPIYVWDVDGHNCFYGLPATDGSPGGVKAAMHSGGQHCTAATISREIDETDVSEVRQYLQRFIPSLNGPLMRASACMYTLTPDANFVLSPHPRYPQVLVACGFSGHGFKFSGVVGEILADLALEGRTDHPIAFLSPHRFNKT